MTQPYKEKYIEECLQEEDERQEKIKKTMKEIEMNERIDKTTQTDLSSDDETPPMSSATNRWVNSHSFHNFQTAVKEMSIEEYTTKLQPFITFLKKI